MARMFPAQIYSGTKSPGEVEIFHRLRDDPVTKSWLVLHSLDVANHRSQVAGEIDFVIIVPTRGVLCLEVKAHRAIRRENGLWYYGSSSMPDARGPFRQAAECMHSMRKRVVDHNRNLSKIVFWSAVIFPFLEFMVSADEWHPWQVVDAKQFRQKSIGALVLNVLDRARSFLATNPSATWFDKRLEIPDIKQGESICNFLRPDFEFFESPKYRMDRRNEELKIYTKEQYDALDGMDLNDRVIFTGPAGTGKTLLAIEAVRRSIGSGRKVLFCCYNRLLGNWLRKQTENILPQENVGTLHSIMLSVTDIVPPSDASQVFWECELPEKAIEKLLLDETGKYKFDELIIDEAQDVLRDSYLDFLDLSLAGGLNSGKWKLFGDFEKQAIYTSSSGKVDELMKRRFTSVPKYGLRVNCRNTPRIASLVRLLGRLNPDYSKIRRPDNKIEPEILPYKKEEQQKENLINTLSSLSKEGYEGSEIIILSPKGDQDAIASKVTLKSFSLRPAKQIPEKNQVSYCTIHAFKGLEAPVVIVTDIEEVGTELSANLFYVAITRSLERLFILVNEKARKEMIEILTMHH